MKQIIAIVKPFLTDKVLASLKRAPLEALSIREVKGFGRHRHFTGEETENEFSMAFLPKVEISMWVEDARLEETLAKVTEAASSQRIGDGKVFVVPVDVTRVF